MSTIKSINLNMGGILRVVAAAVLCVAFASPAAAQSEQVTLSAGEMQVRRAISEIESQTGRRFGFSEDFDLERTARFDPRTTTLDNAAGRIAGDGYNYVYDGKLILIHRKGEEESPRMCYITALVRDSRNGEPLKDASVEILNSRRVIRTRTDGLGYFNVDNIPAGRYIAKIVPPDAGSPLYVELAASARSGAAIDILYREYTPGDTGAEGDFLHIEDATPITQTHPVTTYYFYEKTAEGPMPAGQRRSLSVVPGSAVYSGYLPKTALKTNFIWWATTSMNVAAEFGLGRKWTLDASAVYNPWSLDGDKSRRFWLVQPEARFWFCNRFEKHFIGVHGIYGEYNLGNFEMPFTDVFEGYRYKGDMYGAGISWGYHLPVGKRWGLEFTLGGGWVHLEYDKYKCNACYEFEGNKATDYFGITRAGISLVFMIR